MLTLPITDAAVERALTILREGGVIVHATETCYGLACDLSNPDAVARLFAIKDRPHTMPMSALFSSLEEAKKYVIWTAKADALAAKHLPGPLTLILPLRTDAPARLLPTPQGGDTVGIRVSSHPIALRLAEAFGAPLSTTSANLHGQPNPYDAKAIAAQFTDKEAQPDLILDSGTLPPVPPSTVVDLAGTSTPSVLRAGMIGVEKNEGS
jgi:L-threonylcarbamoyladenylate synthase